MNKLKSEINKATHYLAQVNQIRIRNTLYVLTGRPARSVDSGPGFSVRQKDVGL